MHFTRQVKPVRKMGYWLQKLLSDKNVPDAEEMKRFIDSFPKPENDYDRSHDQYRCIFYGKRLPVRFLLNLCGAIAAPLFLLLYACNRPFVRKRTPCDALVFNPNNKYGMSYDYSGLLPREVLNEFPCLRELRLKNYPPLREGALGIRALRIWLEMVFRHPLSGYLNFNILVHVMFVNRIIREYSPKALLVARMEKNCVCSVISLLCECLGCEYILFMHGDIVLDKNTAFSRFSRMYIWDAHYREIMLWGRSDRTCYIVSRPESLFLFGHDGAPQGPYRYDMCYYLTDNRNLEIISRTLARLAAEGMRIKVRPHPRWSEAEKIRKLFSPLAIEWASEKTLTDSLAETRWILGSSSTVLLQAFYARKEVVLDDISDPVSFSRLKTLRYIMMEKPHRLLSDFLPVLPGQTVIPEVRSI